MSSWEESLMQFAPSCFMQKMPKVWTLKPGHLKEDYPITTFLKIKGCQVFLQTDQ